MTALQITLNASSAINPNDNVLFDSIKYSDGDVAYEPATGLITLSAPGRYAIDWWLAVQSNNSANGSSFALSTSQGDVIEGNSPLKTDEVYGIGIINVDTAPITLSLVNISTGTVFLSQTVPLQGTLVLLEEDIVGATGPAGPTGPEGASAYEVAVDNGFVGTEEQWLESLVGPTGPQGEPGTVPGLMIPFSDSGPNSDYATDANGDPANLVFSGFGKGEHYVELQPGEWQAGTVTFNESTTYFGSSFIMAYDGVLQSVHNAFYNLNELILEDGATVTPFIGIATCNTEELVYIIQQSTITYADPYVGGTPTPIFSKRDAFLQNINLPLPMGTLVAIIAGISAENITEPVISIRLGVSGSILIDSV